MTWNASSHSAITGPFHSYKPPQHSSCLTEAGDRGHGRFPHRQQEARWGSTWAAGTLGVKMEGWAASPLISKTSESLQGRKTGEKSSEQHLKVTTETKSWLTFNYLNKFYFSGHWREFNFYALFDFALWHNPQLSSSLRVHLAQSKEKKEEKKTWKNNQHQNFSITL